MVRIKLIFLCILCLDVFFVEKVCSESLYAGEEAWLHYLPIKNDTLRQYYISRLGKVCLAGSRFDETIKSELSESLSDMLSFSPCFVTGKAARLCMQIDKKDSSLGEEGFRIENQNGQIRISSFSDAGLLYATYCLIRLVQCHESLDRLKIKEIPRIDFRMLNHWDDMDGNIERGYAGNSLWKWNELPDVVNKRCWDYARLNASIGINSVVLNNVNADPRFLRTDYLKKIASLADVFRKYHIRVCLSVNFAAPLKPSKTPDVMKAWGGVGSLETANPREPVVQKWWEEKVREIYRLIPDFGGFLVKANSEGMPGPQDYHCTHADGANMLARALKPYGGFVFWRTFVYNPDIDKDRMKRSYKEFYPLDGLFDDNVVLQTKNGPLDFQVIEPPQPLFGAMKYTNMAAELQITQEYTGHSTYMVYLLPFWKRFLSFDTFCAGERARIVDILEGKVYPFPITAIAGVANTGDSLNWTGHHFAQANWFAFGRLAWNAELAEQQITEEWIKSTWGCDSTVVKIIRQMMLPTWKSFLKSSSPYGLGLTVDIETHYRAAFDIRVHKEWKVDSIGIGTDRTNRGSDYVSQYFEPNRSLFNDIKTCPEDLLLCFHFVNWDYKLSSGNSLRHEFLENLKSGVSQADENIALWLSLSGKIDKIRFLEVLYSLCQEKQDAYAFYSETMSFFREKMKIK